MTNKSSVIARRAWRLLRLALLWTRKGGLFRARLAIKVIRKLAHSNESRRPLVYGDHEFSFDQTPTVRVKMHRPSSSLPFKMPHFPCIQPQVDFDCDFGDDEYDHAQGACEMNDDDVDVRAEKFIAEFYHQMKMQSLE